MKKMSLFFTFILFMMQVLPGITGASGNITGETAKTNQRYVNGEIIVKFKAGQEQMQVSGLKKNLGLSTKKQVRFIGAEVIKVPENTNIDRMVSLLNDSELVEYAQPNYIYYPKSVIPTDPMWDQQWGLHNTGQTINTIAGIADIDIDAPEAWEYANNLDEVVVAVIDSGVDMNHPDLAGKIWTNPGEIPDDGIDNDGNGYIDDVHGWDFYHNDNTVFDGSFTDDHGTHVAGIIAASANHVGIRGVAPNVKIMPLKFLGQGGGSTLDAIEAIEYASMMGVKISNNSWGGPGDEYDTALNTAIENSGMLFIAAAGNNGNNIDETPSSPAVLPAGNILSIAAIDNNGQLSYFSNYGLTTVDMAAPGEDILSTYPEIFSRNAAVTNVVYGKGKTIALGFSQLELEEQSFKLLSNDSMKFFGYSTSDPVGILIVHDAEVDLYEDDPEFKDYVMNYGNSFKESLSDFTSATTVTQFVYSAQSGPDLNTLNNYDVIIWFTDWTYDPLTDDDVANLQSYVDQGGNLIISGANTFDGHMDHPFVTETLGLEITMDAAGGFMSLSGVNSGASGAYFSGHDYMSLIGTWFLDDVFDPNPDVDKAEAVIVYKGSEAGYEYMSGTSMATPMATGIAAALMGQKNLTPLETKNLMMQSGVSLDSLQGNTVTGKMVNLYHAVATSVTQPTVVENTYSYSVNFKTSPYGKLLTNDTMTIVFPDVAVMPGSITADNIKVNGVPVGTSSSIIHPNGTSITFHVPVEVNHNGYVNVVIDQGANIMVPLGSHTLDVSTSTDPVAVTSAAFEVDGQTASTGGGGGSGGGGSIIVPEEPAISELPGEIILETREDEVIDGDKTIVNIIDEKLQLSLENHEEVERVAVKILTNTREVEVNIHAASLENILKRNHDAVFVIQSEIGSYDLPVNAINFEKLATELGAPADDLKMTVRMNKLTAEQQKMIDEAVHEKGAKTVTDSVEFEIEVNSNGKSITINQFGSKYVNRTIRLNNENIDPDHTTGVMYNLQTNAIQFVPTFFNKVDGSWEATIKRNGNSIYTIVENDITFDDIQNYWAKEQIENLASKFIVKGVTENQFAPRNPVTRAEFTALIVRSLGLTEGSESYFKDVASDDWYHGVVAAAVEAGLIKGYDDNTFQPDREITREELAVLISRAADYAGKPFNVKAYDNLDMFKDRSEVSSWAQGSVIGTNMNGITQGRPGSLFAPKDTATRAEAVVMIVRLLQYLEFIN